MNRKTLKAKLQKIKGVRFLEVHAVTTKGKMITISLHNNDASKTDNKKNI